MLLIDRHKDPYYPVSTRFKGLCQRVIRSVEKNMPSKRSGSQQALRGNHRSFRARDSVFISTSWGIICPGPE